MAVFFTGLLAMLIGSAQAGAIPPPPSAIVSLGATPASLPPPGGTFHYTVQLTNGGQAVTITSLADTVYGNLNSAGHGTCTGRVGTPVPAHGTFSCEYDGIFTGPEGAALTNRVTVLFENAVPTTGGDYDEASVTILTPPPIVPTLAAAIPPVTATGQRAAALKKCKKKHKRKARKKCKRKATLLPV